MSKLEQLFEQETLKERDNYNEGADDSTTELALARLKSTKEKLPEVLCMYCIQKKNLLCDFNPIKYFVGILLARMLLL